LDCGDFSAAFVVTALPMKLGRTPCRWMVRPRQNRQSSRFTFDVPFQKAAENRRSPNCFRYWEIAGTSS